MLRPRACIRLARRSSGEGYRLPRHLLPKLAVTLATHLMMSVLSKLLQEQPLHRRGQGAESGGAWRPEPPI